MEEAHDLGVQVGENLEYVTAFLRWRGVHLAQERGGGGAYDGQDEGGEMGEEHLGAM